MEPNAGSLLNAIRLPSNGDASSPNAKGSSSGQVMLSVPFVGTASDSIFAEPNLGQQLEGTTPSDVVQLNVPDSGALQTFIQTTQQRFVGFASGSMFWRLFVGSGFAVFVGALTLILLGPTSELVTADATDSSLQAVDQQPQPTASAAVRQPPSGAIELTVSTQDGAGGPVPAEFDDPFVAANLVPTKTVHAVHVTSAGKGETSGLVYQASHRPASDASPAWLAGTIEEAVDSPQSTRKYERSRPSHR